MQFLFVEYQKIPDHIYLIIEKKKFRHQFFGESVEESIKRKSWKLLGGYLEKIVFIVIMFQLSTRETSTLPGRWSM